MAGERRVHRDIRGQSATRPPDAAIAALAARQHGVVDRLQLIAAGLSDDAIDRRIAAGRLHCLHRGVYAVGHTSVSLHGVWMASVLAAGPKAVLSHRAAAALWRIRHPRNARPDVIAPRRVDRPRIRAHRMALQADEVTVERGIPVTTPARTLFDLAGALTPQQLEATITEAEIARLTSPTSLAVLLARHPKHRGTAGLRRILEHNDRVGRTVTRSELEIAFLVFLDAHALPRPRTNATIELDGGRRPMVDAAWPDRRLVAELDSYGIHMTRRTSRRTARATSRSRRTAGVSCGSPGAGSTGTTGGARR